MNWVGHADDDDAWEAMQRLSEPDNEVPVVVPMDALLARTQDVAIAVSGARVYSTGVSFDLLVRVRSAGRIGTDVLHELVGGFGPHGAGAGLLLGVEFADGRSASTIGGHDLDAPPHQPLLVEGGGGGGGHAHDASYWLTPPPPPGPLKIVLACEALGVPETSVTVDAGLISAAVESVTVLWPPERPADDEPPEIELPDLPADSWFAQGRRDLQG